jgi:diaminopimelate epimerase
MEKISFFKMSGAGNDFILIDRNKVPDIVLNQNLIRKLCDRRNGVGADGIITISNSQSYDFDMEYFNADGSTGSLCGNGARCAIKFADLSGRIKSGRTNFLSNSIPYSGEVLDENKIKFNFNSPKNLKFNFFINAYNQMINSCYADTGSPHVIIKVEDILRIPGNPKSYFNNLNEVPVFEIGKEIRFHRDFEPIGTNVNFIKIIDNKVYIRTYERGVENETLACGTGATASALIAHYQHKLAPPVHLITKGGDELIVDFSIEGKNINNLSLTGPAKITFTGEFSLNQFN